MRRAEHEVNLEEDGYRSSLETRRHPVTKMPTLMVNGTTTIKDYASKPRNQERKGRKKERERESRKRPITLRG
jgi:hypothetical protein